MLNTIFKQLSQPSHPLGAILTVNTRAIEQLSTVQMEFWTGYLNDTRTYFEDLAVQKNINDLFLLNMTYSQTLFNRTTTAFRDTMACYSDLNQEYAKQSKKALEGMVKLPKQAIETVKESAAKVVAAKTATADTPVTITATPTVSAKPQAVRKAASKSTAKKPSSTVKQVANSQTAPETQGPQSPSANNVSSNTTAAKANATAKQAPIVVKPSVVTDEPNISKTESNEAN